MNSLLYDDITKVLDTLKTTDKGLSSAEVTTRLNKYGHNKLVQQKRTPYIVKFLVQFTDLLAIVLLTAAGLAYILGAPKDAIVIFLVVIANSTIGFFQEYKADKAIDALKKFVAQSATVIRDNDRQTIDAMDIVPGDIIVLSEGMKIPADIRLISANELETNDAALTGESETQSKVAMVTEENERNVVDVTGSVFMGTDVISGNGIGVVVSTGMETSFGKIAKITSTQKVSKSPLQIEIDRIAKTVAKATFWVVLILLVVDTVAKGHFDALESFRFAIGVASSLVPEGLPATVSIALAIGIQKMTRRKAAIRRLSAVETLGEANYIITDKTGTLTKNQMTVKEIYFNNENYHIKGVGYSLDGEITREGKLCNRSCLDETNILFQAVTISNNAEVDTKNHHKPDYIGDSTEIALLVAAEKAGLDTYTMQREAKSVEEIPFTSERKFMAKAVDYKGEKTVYVKGAPAVILQKCTKILKGGKAVELTTADRKDIEKTNDEYSKDALRVIASAYKPMDGSTIDSDLIFLGLLGIIDPPREDVAETVRIAKEAGIKIIMATGDYGLTAAAVGKRIKLNIDPRVIDGNELNQLKDDELYQIIETGDVIFSRVDPIHKLRLVKVLQAHGNIVSVTGDGVNDAPALKTSDIGVAMGLTGTDVTKEAAEMVSLNDSFSSIVWAVKEGRIVYDNIKKATKYVFTANMAEFTAVVFGLVIGLPPIFVIQILLIDLCAEAFPALALAGDIEEDDVMSKPPRDKKDILFGTDTIYYIVRSGIMLGVFSVAGFCIYGYLNGWRWGSAFPNNETYIAATTVTYATMALCQYANAFSIRSARKPVWKLLGSQRVWIGLAVSFMFVNLLIYVPFLQKFAGMAPLNFSAWAIAIFIALFYLLVQETFKARNKPPKRITQLVAEKLVSK
ncbi:MAG: cation-transporting P-type ATPase [bacterium]